MKKKMIKRSMAIGLIMAMTTVQISSGQWTIIASAAPRVRNLAMAATPSDARSINLGTAGIASPSQAEPGEEWRGDHVYYGRYFKEASPSDAQKASPSDAQKKPVNWRALGGDSDGLMLFSHDILDQYLFNSREEPLNSWEESTIQNWMNEEMFSVLFSREEKKTVMPAKGGAEKTLTIDPEEETDGPAISLNNPNRAGRLFLMSAAEVTNPAYGFGGPAYRVDDETKQLMTTPYARSRGADLSTDGRNAWWLRSGQEGSSYNAGSVDIDGWIGADMASEVDVNGIAPACFLDRDQILLTSLAEGGKNGEAEPSSELLPIDRVDRLAGDESQNWKLTIMDEAHKNFTMVESSKIARKNGEEDVFTMRAVPGDTVPIHYKGAVAGTDRQPETISAILKSEDQELFYYGKLKTVDSQEDRKGIVYLTLPDELEEGETYTVLLFEERCNGDYETDYASPFSTLELEVLRERSIDVTGGVILSVASPSDAEMKKPIRLLATPADAERSGTAYDGYQVRVQADEAPEDMGFHVWRTTPVNLDWKNQAGADHSRAEFTMPDMDVTLRSAYKNLASPSDATVSQKVLPKDWMAYGDWDDLEQMVNDREVLTEENWEKIEKGWNFDISFTMERKDGQFSHGEAAEAIRAQMEEGETTGFFLVNSLKKHIVSRDKLTNRTEELDQVSLPIAVTLPLPDACQDMAGYRLLGVSPGEEEPREYDFFWKEGGKSRVLSFTAEANGIYALVYMPIDNVLRINCPDITYGELLEPEVLNNPFDGPVIFTYQRRDGTDSTISETPPVDVGLYKITATIEETEQYETIVRSQEFEIRKKPIRDSMITVEYSQPYLGREITPEVIVSDISSLTGEELICEEDYTIRYENNRNPGKAKVIVEAQTDGNYKGTGYAEFAISPRDSGSSSNIRENVNTKGTWIQDALGLWRFYKEEAGIWACNEWLKIKGYWYYFGVDEFMKTGWLNLHGKWYYLREEKDRTEGQMFTGWLLDAQDGNWYYLKPDGEMAVGYVWLKDKQYYMTGPEDAVSGWKQNPKTGKWYFDLKESRPLGSWKE